MDLFSKAMNLRKIYSTQKKGYKLEDKKEFSIVRSTLSKYGLPTKNFDRNLSSLIIEPINEKLTEDGKIICVAGTYNPETNVLVKPEDENDFIHELFHMASNNMEEKSLEGSRIKIGRDTFGTSMNEGITDYFTSLAKKNYKNKYPFESLIVEYIAKIYGMDIFREHFNGNAIEFYASFKQDEVFIRNVVMFLDEFHNSVQARIINDRTIIYPTESEIASATFIDCICEFVRLLQLKKIDEKDFLKDLKRLMNSKNSEYVTYINAHFSLSSFRGKENIYNKILEVLNEEEFNL